MSPRRKKKPELIRSLHPSPVGPLELVASAEGLVAIRFVDEPDTEIETGDTSLSPSAWSRLAPIRVWLDRYFGGERVTSRDFDGPIAVGGTPFQRQVWEELTRIPYGRTCSYAAIALAIGRPNALRAVGMANHRNPLPILWPCHRVIGQTGKLVGYAGGLRRKERLLALEQGGELFAEG